MASIKESYVYWTQSLSKYLISEVRYNSPYESYETLESSTFDRLSNQEGGGDALLPSASGCINT